jgi:DsbC/DsbD-like thiol-disulfide interchange protein
MNTDMIVKDCLAFCACRFIPSTLENTNPHRVMKKLFTFFLPIFILLSASAQTQDPVHWKTSYKPTSITEGEIIIEASIDKGWHTYSQRPTDAGPISTSFTINPTKNYKLVGKVTETDAHEEFDEAFGAKLFVYHEKAEFHQKIRLTSKGGFNIPFKVEFICCNDRMCLPPKTVDLSVKVP